MVESSILGTSPWNSDPFLCKDLNPFPGLDCQGILEMGFNEQETNAEKLGFSHEFSIQNQLRPIPRTDDFWASYDDDIVSPLTSDSLGFESLIWTADSITNSSWTSDSSSDMLTDGQSHRKRNTPPDPLAAGKSWSRMTAEEQLGTVEALTQIISHQMGLREQLEVIKIIDPVAVISSADTEFVIDLARLDDRKLQRIRSYVQKHALEFVPHIRNGITINTAPSISSESSGSSGGGSGGGGSGGGSGSSSSRLGLDDCFTSSKPSKKQLRECKQLKAWHQRQHRQKLKEKRSGLFNLEEVVSLTTPVPEPEVHEIEIEDIDILA